MLTFEQVVISAGAFRLSVDLAVEVGEITAGMGPSGAGKSTLLSAVAGFLDVSGVIQVDGAAVQDKPPSARPLSILFQDSNLFPHMTAFQNVALGAMPSLRLSEDQKEAVTEALRRVGLDGFESQAPCRAGNKAGWPWRGYWCATSRWFCWMSLLRPWALH